MPKVVRVVLEPIEWEYNGTVWRLMHDIETAPELLEPDAEGRMVPPTASQAIEWLPLIVDEKQHKKLATAIDKNTWPAVDRWGAVKGWWNYMTGRAELQDAMWAEAQARRDLVARIAAAKTEPPEPEPAEDDTLPLDD